MVGAVSNGIGPLNCGWPGIAPAGKVIPDPGIPVTGKLYPGGGPPIASGPTSGPCEHDEQPGAGPENIGPEITEPDTTGLEYAGIATGAR